jgi:hypothetical protein
MKVKNITTLITLAALNSLFLCHAQNVFLHNNYGASIYYKTSSSTQPQEIRNNIRIPLGTIEDIEKTNAFISGTSALSASYYSLKPTITKIGFAATQHPKSDAVIYINPSSFYQAWNIGTDWEKRTADISSFKIKEIHNKTAKEQLLNMLTFIKKPVYKQGQGKNQQIISPINRTNDEATIMAIEMALNEPYEQETLTEIYDIVDKHIPFQLSYNNEATLKQQALAFLRTEINRLKQK